MQKIPENYIEKVYAGWLGKMIGVRSGANIEMWTHEHIRRVFGELEGYPHSFKTFAADDDTNGPLFFIRALEDYSCSEDLTSEEIGKTWLNYVPDSRRFFWWSGYGVSTEHTAYENLKNGISAPQSGSAKQNGITVAEQVGGQIFIDTWGLIAPGNPEMAARFAKKAASVSHDRNGVYGGMFIASAIAAAFVVETVEEALKSALRVIPKDCDYACMVRDVMEQSRGYKTWYDCLLYVEKVYFGKDKYPGNCHIIPNGAIIVLALMYGKGRFSDAINISNRCGFDTDCNSANVGTIMGVLCGLEGIEQYWRAPINDFLCAASTIGSLNQLDVPTCATYIARFGYRLAKEEFPQKYRAILEGNAPRYHFILPGSTHGFQADDNAAYTGRISAEEGCLKVSYDWWELGMECRAYIKTEYTAADFDDSRYDPCFSPILYPGQTISANVMVPGDIGIAKANACCWAKDSEGEVHVGERISLIPGEYSKLTCKIPHLDNRSIVCAGVEWIPMEADSGEEVGFTGYIEWLDFGGNVSYRQDFGKAQIDKWNDLHINIRGFSYLRGIWRLENETMTGSYSGESAEIYTGDYRWRDISVTAKLLPQIGEIHNINVRVQGAMRSYAAGFAPNGKIVLYKNNCGYKKLAEAEFIWEKGKIYELCISAVEDRLTVSIDQEEYISYVDTHKPYLHGCIGFSNSKGAVTSYYSYEVKTY